MWMRLRRGLWRSPRGWRAGIRPGALGLLFICVALIEVGWFRVAFVLVAATWLLEAVAECLPPTRSSAAGWLRIAGTLIGLVALGALVYSAVAGTRAAFGR